MQQMMKRKITPYPEGLSLCSISIDDFIRILRSIQYKETSLSESSGINGFYESTMLCSQYAESVFRRLKSKIKNNPYLKTHILRLDRVNFVTPNKSAIYGGRYNDIIDADQYNSKIKTYFDELALKGFTNITLFSDRQSMPAPLESIFKSRSLRMLLIEYISEYLILNFQNYVDETKQDVVVILDGIEITPRLEKYLTPGSFQNDNNNSDGRFPDEYRYNPLILMRDPESTFLRPLPSVCRVATLEFCNMIGEADLGVLFWFQKLNKDAIIDSQDGDLILILLYYVGKLLRAGVTDIPRLYLNKGTSIGRLQPEEMKIIYPGRYVTQEEISGLIDASLTKEDQRRVMDLSTIESCSPDTVASSGRCSPIRNPFYIDIVQLHHELMGLWWLCEKNEEPKDLQSQIYKTIFPVELFGFLCSLDGNDFTRVIPLKRMPKIWECFTSMPSRYRHMVRVEPTGDPNVNRYGLVMDVYLEFICHLHKPPTSSSSKSTMKFSRDYARKIMNELQEKNKDKKPAKSYVSLPYDVDAVLANGANACWFMAYIGNGYNKDHTVNDPFLKDENGTSIYGWNCLYSHSSCNLRSQIKIAEFADRVKDCEVIWCQ